MVAVPSSLEIGAMEPMVCDKCGNRRRQTTKGKLKVALDKKRVFKGQEWALDKAASRQHHGGQGRMPGLGFMFDAGGGELWRMVASVECVRGTPPRPPLPVLTREVPLRFPVGVRLRVDSMRNDVAHSRALAQCCTGGDCRCCILQMVKPVCAPRNVQPRDAGTLGRCGRCGGSRGPGVRIEEDKAVGIGRSGAAGGQTVAGWQWRRWGTWDLSVCQCQCQCHVKGAGEPAGQG